MEKSRTPVDEMIASLDGAVRSDIETLDSVIAAEMTGLSRVLWEGKMWGGTDQRIIGYGAYSAENSRGETVDWFMVGLAAQKKYLSVYVNAVEDGSYLAVSTPTDWEMSSEGRAASHFGGSTRSTWMSFGR